MKLEVLYLCLISIAAARPVNKSKQHAVSASSEEKYDPRGHHSHRYQHHMNSQSWETLESPQQTLYSSEESADVPAQPHFPDVSSKSHEDVKDDDDGNNDSNDTDESDEVVTSLPTDIAVTVPFPPFPFTRGDNAGRGDSVAYRLRAKATALQSSKLHKAAKKLIVYDATEEDESALNAVSHQAEFSQEGPYVLGKHTVSGEWAGKSHRQDSSQQDSKQHDQSMENNSLQKSDSHETKGDDTEADVRGDSHQSTESRESQVQVPAEVPEDNSNQTLESVEDAQDQQSIENNEVTL
ncbi:osteopontin [Phaethornis superciliosus]